MESLVVDQTAGCSDTDALLSDQDQGTHIKDNLCLNVYIGHNALVSPAVWFIFILYTLFY